jgi:predicted porin
MQKKLLAVAVAGAMFSPLAMAQSSVTISGVFKVGVDNVKIGNPRSAAFGAATSAAGGVARTGLNTNEWRVTDNSSRMIFGITEDIGGGLFGIAQLDARFQPDDAGGNFAESGNTWVGVRSNTLGTLTFGRHDLHYGKQPDDIAAKAGALMASSVSLMDYTYLTGAVAAGLAPAAVGPAGPTIAIANATRTPNVVRYDTPNFGGFAATIAYSTSAFGDESDMRTGGRKGNAWNFNPSFTSGPFQVGASLWKAKGDATATAATLSGFNQDSLALYGYYRLGAFKVGAAFNNSEVEAIAGGVTTAIVDRRNWTIPVSWSMGPHNVYAHYTKAGKDKAAAALPVPVNDTEAKMWAFAYVYDLSKRTSVGVTYAAIDNKTNASYNLFTNTGSLGTGSSIATPGEDPKLLAFTVRHGF